MNDQEIVETIGEVRAARYQLLTMRGARDEIYKGINQMDGEARKVLRHMLADDLWNMRRLGMKAPRRQL